jgi:putative membrane protein
MKPDPRRTLRSLAIAGALLIAVPAPGYAQDIASSLTTPPFVVRQADDGANDNDAVGGTEEGSAAGGLVFVPGPQPFLRTAVSDSATDMEAARLVLERSEDPAVKQFAALMLRQSEMMMEDAAKTASMAGVGARQAPTAEDETALIEALSTLSGRELDETYLRATIQDHRVAIADYMAARQGMTDGNLDPAAAYADRHLGMLTDQLRAATELAMRLGIEIDLS